MDMVKEGLKASLDYIRAFLKWAAIAVVIGLAGGVLGSVFHKSIDYATHLREENTWLIFLLPLGGLMIAAVYSFFKKSGRIDTNRVLESARTDKNVPLVMAPLIFVSTIITHLFGGSVGREGAALQLGGSMAYNLGKVFRLKKDDLHIIVLSGMASVFAALFGTPLTAAFFALEVVNVGVMHYAALVPCLISSIAAYGIALLFGISPVHFDTVAFAPMALDTMVKVILLALLCALVSILFCTAIQKCEHYAEKLLPNRYLRAFLGSAVIVLLTLILGTYDYNGAGMEVIGRALTGEVNTEAFALKILFTAITIAAGFKGGEIVPAFFVGATFGCAVGPLLGLDPSFGAAVGFVALFCGVVNCPVASVMLALEVFGGEGILVFAAAAGVSYMMSGYFGLYRSQKIVYSKLDEHYININTK